MTSGKHADFNDTFYLSLSIKYGFVLSIIVAQLEGLPGYSGTDWIVEMSVLFQAIVILTSLASDWSTIDVIFSYDVRQNSDNIFTF